MFYIAMIEDEKEIMESLQKDIVRFFHEEQMEVKVDWYDCAEKFLAQYKFQYDLVLMDIQLPEMDGMHAVEQLRKKDEHIKVIFITSLAQYAIKGYEVNAFDFIVKPVPYYQLALKLKRVLENYTKMEERGIVIKTNSSFVRINISDIRYIEVRDHRLMFHCGEDVYETFDTLNKYLERLKEEPFALCNRCYLVHLRYVTRVNKDGVYVEKEWIQMSRRRQKDFLNALNEYLGNGGDLHV